MGEFRPGPEPSDKWDETPVLLPADHWWRRAPAIDRRVPFLLKLPQQREQLMYPAPFNTVLLPGLALSIIDRAVRTPADAVTWLDRRAAGQVSASPFPPPDPVK